MSRSNRPSAVSRDDEHGATDRRAASARAGDEATQRTVAAIWRIEGARIIGAIARMVRDVPLAEELAQDALVAALEHWPRDTIPDNPGAWLMATAKNRALDHLRREKTLATKHEEIGRDLEAREALVVPDFVDALDAARADRIGDDMLRLVFTACHPVLPVAARTALTLRLVVGLTTEEIARAYLVPEPTIAQRIVRAKRTLSQARVGFDLPSGEALAERLAAVLEVIYLIFNEGYTATRGEHWMRPELTNEAMRIGRILAQLAPEEPEVHGLVALMELQGSRSAARVDAAGRPVLLSEQDRGRWDRLLIRRGLAALERAELLSASRGPYTLQAAIAACHARAPTAAQTDWPRIASLYDELARVMPSPVVELNRAVAVSMAGGVEQALSIVEGLAGHPLMRDYHWLPSVRADLLSRLGRHAEASAEFERAAAMARNGQERTLLATRAADSARRVTGR